jgi:hypothetical protein
MMSAPNMRKIAYRRVERTRAYLPRLEEGFDGADPVSSALRPSATLRLRGICFRRLENAQRSQQ